MKIVFIGMRTNMSMEGQRLYFKVKTSGRRMNALKRSLPAPHSTIIVIDSDSEEVVALPSPKADNLPNEFVEFLSPYDVIPEVPTVHLTAEEMNSDPL